MDWSIKNELYDAEVQVNRFKDEISDCLGINPSDILDVGLEQKLVDFCTVKQGVKILIKEDVSIKQENLNKIVFDKIYATFEGLVLIIDTEENMV